MTEETQTSNDPQEESDQNDTTTINDSTSSDDNTSDSDGDSTADTNDTGSDDVGKDSGGDKDDAEDKELNLDELEPESRTKQEIEEDKKKDDDEEIDEDDAKTINKVVDKKISRLEQRLQEQTDELEINSYLAEHPEFTKFKPVIKKYVAHPAYKNIPIKNIVAIVGASDLIKLGAKKERDAAQRAKDTRGGGQQARKPGAGKVDWLKVPKEEFEAKLTQVMQGN